MIDNNKIDIDKNNDIDIDYLDDLIVYFSRLRDKEKNNKNIYKDSLTLYRKYMYHNNLYRSKL